MNYSKGPWHACHDGKCPCKTVWSNDHPVAEIVHGKWGDDFPNIRLVGPCLDLKAEAFEDQITYGEVDEKEAEVNARLISEAPAMYGHIKKCADSGDVACKKIIDYIATGKEQK
jgi:hypothetical protein